MNPEIPEPWGDVIEVKTASIYRSRYRYLHCMFMAAVHGPQNKQFGRPRVTLRRHGGFALVVTVSLMVLLAIVAIGFVSLSSIQIRESLGGKYEVEARANARLALMLAVGELQKQLGPDQRVSARAGILDGASGDGSTNGIEEPHWTAVWSSTTDGGESLWSRDDSAGGLRDRRFSEAGDEWNSEDAVLSYLVSGNEGGRAARKDALFEAAVGVSGSEGNAVQLVGPTGSGANDGTVSVPIVPVSRGGREFGGYGFWVSDLGTKANVATRNPYANDFPNPRDSSDGGYYRLMASQEVDESMMGDFEFEEDDKARMLGAQQVALVSSNTWVRERFHDFTTYSRGVLADVRDGGLKKDLTVYLEQGQVQPWNNLPGLSHEDRLVGPRNEAHAKTQGVDWATSRHRETAPRFGMLWDWANRDVAFQGGTEAARTPASEVNPVLFKGGRAALANDKPTALTGRVRTDLQPILVEASAYSTFSYHPNPTGWRKLYNIRSHSWPRVVLWNPYNVAIQVPRSVVMMQLNTRNDFMTATSVGDMHWVSWGGGTRSDPPIPGQGLANILHGENYNDPYTGMTYYSLPEEVIGPGECYVYSAEKAAEYDSENLLNNRLSSEVAPDPSRNYYVSSAEFDDDNQGSGFNFTINQFWYSPFDIPWMGIKIDNQADDARMIWKRADEISSMDVFDFDDLPQMQFVSCSLQYGAGKEPRVAWSELNKMRVEKTDLFNPVLRTAPDVRTREGFRLRWFLEHESNTGVLNNPAGPGVFETALLANWNPRGAYALRSPWENIGGDQGDGSASGPWFFGAYTRDLYDEEAVGWGAQMPVLSGGNYRGNPFGLPQEGRLRNILFDVARSETGVLSMAQFQHVKLSDFVWHPSYPVGNSLVDPRLGHDAMDGTAPPLGAGKDALTGGWSADAIGWSGDKERSADRDEWARFARGAFQDHPENENLVHDLSFDLNHALWDEFFLGSGTRYDRKALAVTGRSLPNGRIVPRHGATEEEIVDFHRAAHALYVNGAFNVNSTSVAAWKAVLASTRPVGYGRDGATCFPRVLNPVGGEWQSGDANVDVDDDVWSGYRSLTEDEVERLAEEIVWQVKNRGPFLSMSDFVNRRLSKGLTGRMGPLQAAIEAAGLNSVFDQAYELLNDEDIADYRHPDHIKDATRMAQDLKPGSKAWGAPGYLTQADVLQVLGPMLTVRSDSFLIRTYGEAKDGEGNVKASAWCEAVVQRTPEPVIADDSGINPDPDSGPWGRMFEMVSFRWLSRAEVEDSVGAAVAGSGGQSG